MRKRNKSPKAKGSRAGSTRGGRGGFRGGVKSSREIGIQRQSNIKSSSISTTGYSFHTSRLNPHNVHKRRVGGDSSTTTGSVKQSKDNHHNHNVVAGSNGRTGVVGMMNVNGVGVGDGPQPPTPNSNSNHFYLHKKFKKVTSTPLEDSNELGSATSSKISANNNSSSNGSLIVSVNSVKLNGVLEVNGSDSDISLPAKKFPEKTLRNSSSSVSATTTSSSVSAIQNSCSSSTGLGAIGNSNQPTTSSSSSSESSAANSQSSSSSNPNSSVYKPKFRISTEVDVGEPVATPISTSSSSSRSQESKYKGKEPSRIERDHRIDRQSLDDRISKIIDENQSILATWPEHMTKRLKSQSSKAAQSPRANNQMVIMSGGSTTELSSVNNHSHPTLNLAKSHLQVIPSASRLPSFEIQNDIGYSSSTVQINPQSHSGLFFTTNNNPNTNIGVGQSSLDKTTEFSDGSISDLSFTNCGSSSTTTSMVPKKRRRLSPTPSRLCGGEVSELPVNEVSSTNKNYFQDVDMTVRVSNCGPSGAQVTIRTNNSSSMNSSSIQSAGVGAVHFSPLIDVPLSKNKNSMFFHSDHFTNDPLMAVNPKDEPCSAIDLKVTKSRGRSPRKSKIHQQSSLDTNVNATGECLPTTGLPVIDLSFPGNKGDAAKQSVSLVSPSVRSSSAGSLTSPLISISPRHELAADQDVSDSSEKTPLLSQSSNSNPKRPTFLALKPANDAIKVTDPTVLPSPDTPRGSKQFNQMSMNGNTYTNLGFKVSTRSSYTCLFKAQPMFVPQDTDSKLSMYSNWQPRMTVSKEGDVSLSANDSRVNGRKSPQILYTSAVGKGCDTLTVSSPVRQAPISSPVDSSKPFFIEKLRESSEREASPSHIDLSARVAHSPSSSRACSTPESSWTTSVAATAPLALTTKSNGFVRSACISPPSNSCGSNSSSYHPASSSTSTKTAPPAALTSWSNAAAASFSDSSSADESSSSCPRNIANSKSASSGSGSYPCDQPLSLTINQNRSLSASYAQQPEDISTNSSLIHSPVVMNRFDNPRVRIMEGGFESNEDYTYVRGRGRGRYVCEACGIRCKKPSMLRKHLKTHTDLRPYTCKLCNFSFKTKGNLTKHQKSKSHHKKCSSLGIHPNSSRSLAMIGPSFSISDTNTTDDNDSDDDEDDNGVDNEDLESDSNSQGEDGDTQSGPENDNENASFEKEIAQSLLDLSKISRLPLGSQSEDSNNTSTTQEPSSSRPQSQPITFSVRGMLEEVKAAETPGSSSVSSPVPDSLETPMDLSVKPRALNASSESELKNGYVRSFGIVGEAQRWEPEEDLMLNGCLNLKKVRNTNSSPPLETKPSVNFAQISVPIPPQLSIPIQVDIKTEVAEIPVEMTEKVEMEKPKPCVNKRKRDSSVSSVEENSSTVILNSSQNILPVKGSDSLQLSLSPPSQQQTQGSTSTNPTPKQQKLHQPWLSSPDAKENDKEVDLVVVAPVPAPAPIPPTLPPPPTAQQSASASAAAIVMQQAEETFSPVGLMKSSQEEIDVGNNESVIGSYDSSVDVSSPNSKTFSGHPTIKPQAEFRQPSGAQALVKDEGKAECNVCGKTFARASQLTLHMNIHYLERPFRCDPCGVSFRTKGHLIKHRRSSSHDCKVYLTEAWGVANEENPRPFKCPDCKIAFRIHGHLAKHLRSKMHIMRMECLGKLPFGIYFEMEKSGMNLNEIDTTDCDMSLVSLQNLARKIYGENWMERLTAPTEEPA